MQKASSPTGKVRSGKERGGAESEREKERDGEGIDRRKEKV